jgi:integrase
VIKKVTIHKFVTEQGYELVQKFGKSQTSKLLEISRPTIDAILREHPTPPAKTLPKYVFQWEETAGNKLFAEKYQGRLKASTYGRIVLHGLRAWLYLDKKDPASWDIEDYRKVWQCERFRDPITGKVRFLVALSFRKWMRGIGRGDLCALEEFTTKGLRGAKGARKQWFLEDEEIERFIEAMDREDLLVAFVLSVFSGGRASSVMPTENGKGVRPMDIDERNCGILMFEPKRQEYVPRLFHPRVIELVMSYVHDCAIKPNESLFVGYSAMRELLKEVARKAGVSKVAQMRGAWHIAKHTFVSQGAYHGLSIEVISEQTGTDANTLIEFYAGIKEKKMRKELLGEKIDIEPFHEWALRVVIEPAIRRYNKLAKV